jgi:hypothetical protein
MLDIVIYRRVCYFIFKLQKSIAELSKQGKKELAFKLMNIFSFNLLIRLYIINEIKQKSSQFFFDFGEFKISSVKYCFFLLKQTK